MLRCDGTTTANLTLIKGKSNVGSIKKSKTTVGSSKLVLINQSVTGLYEEREVLE